MNWEEINIGWSKEGAGTGHFRGGEGPLHVSRGKSGNLLHEVLIPSASLLLTSCPSHLPLTVTHSNLVEPPLTRTSFWGGTGEWRLY